MMEKFLKPIYDITSIFLSAKYKTANLYFLGLYKIGRLLQVRLGCWSFAQSKAWLLVVGHLLQVSVGHDNFMPAMVKDMKVKV
jgi:hypothetical protein